MSVEPQWNCFCDLCMAEAIQEANEYEEFVTVEEDFWTWEMDEV